jgi:hypothetical protein
VAIGRASSCWFDCWFDAPSASDVQLTGLMPHQPLRVRAVVYPLAPARPAPGVADHAMDVAAVLTVRLPPIARSMTETLRVVRTAYDADERGSRPVEETFTQRLVAGPTEETRYDVTSRFTLPPGRHQIRFSATSTVGDAFGSVIADVEVPDGSRASRGASPIILGTPAGAAAPPPFGALLPLVPMTNREFSRTDRISAFVRLLTGRDAVTMPVVVTPRLIASHGRDALDLETAEVAVDRFGADGTADYLLELPLASLESGLHLLSVTARFEGSRDVRRDLVFRMR